MLEGRSPTEYRLENTAIRYPHVQKWNIANGIPVKSRTVTRYIGTVNSSYAPLVTSAMTSSQILAAAHVHVSQGSSLDVWDLGVAQVSPVFPYTKDVNYTMVTQNCFVSLPVLSLLEKIIS